MANVDNQTIENLDGISMVFRVNEISRLCALVT